jgi:hypothetical protein
MAYYDPSMKVLEARQKYFDENGFGDGGYNDKFVKGKLGPIPVYLPNTKTRLRGVKLHDLHHLATGYDTSLLGEAQISAWELAAGGMGIYKSAAIYVFIALLTGLFINPKSVWLAYKRGKGCRNLFDIEFTESLLSLTVGELRGKVGLGAS